MSDIFPLRVAHIITRLILGGAQENTILNCEGLMQLYNDDVLLITGPPLGPEGSLLERVVRNGVPHVIVPTLRRAIHPFWDWKAYWDIKRILKNFKPDVVHTHSAKAGILGRAAASALHVPRIVHGVHGAPFYPEQNAIVRRFYIQCERWAAKRTDSFICVADAMTDILVNANVAPKEKCVTIYSGMETEPFLNAEKWRIVTRRELGIKDDEIVFGKIARLFPLKGHEFVIEAAKSVVGHMPNARFLFIGDGILKSDLEKRVRICGLEKHFIFAGLVQPERIPAFISACDVVVHTSLREGLARVLPQSLIVGRPIISFDIDGAREVAINGETGFLLPPKSVSALSEAMISLAQNPELRAKMGKEGQKRFAEQFDYRKMTELIRKEYAK